MRRSAPPLLAAMIAAALGTMACRIALVSAYDANVDEGLGEFRKKVNVLAVEAGTQAGSPEGTFEKYKPRYAELETQLALLRSRVVIAEASDVNCEPAGALKDVIARLPGIVDALKKLPATSAPTQKPPKGVPVTGEDPGAAAQSAPRSAGCMTRLLDNIGAQLIDMESIHADPQHCAAADAALTCFRAAAAKGALGPMNRSIDMALLVQMAKRRAAEEN